MEGGRVGTTVGTATVCCGSPAPIDREMKEGMPVASNEEPRTSAAGNKLDRHIEDPDLRQQRIARIKAAIEEGTYDTDAKLEAALSKLFDSLGVEFEADSE